jgi:hypothetical protein
MSISQRRSKNKFSVPLSPHDVGWARADHKDADSMPIVVAEDERRDLARQPAAAHRNFSVPLSPQDVGWARAGHKDADSVPIVVAEDERHNLARQPAAAHRNAVAWGMSAASGFIGRRQSYMFARPV